MLNILQIAGGETEALNQALNYMSRQIRVAMPGIIQGYDEERHTCSVQLAIREKVIDKDGNLKDTDIPLLLDVVPIQLFSGGCFVSMPIKAGDECLVIFGDMCIDGWWQNGGVNNQAEMRRHDLSDGFCIIGVQSRPNAAPYNASVLQIGNGSQRIEISESDINISGNLKINGSLYMPQTE